MLVRDVMSTSVGTVDANATVRDAVGHMLEDGIGSVVVTKDGNPAGILTKVDVLRVGHEHDRPLSEIPVYAATSRPLVTARPSDPVRVAAARMFEEDIHHLPVAEDTTIEGVVTATDLLDAQDDLLAESREDAERREEWDA
jgi:CBS domain-containing protein